MLLSLALRGSIIASSLDILSQATAIKELELPVEPVKTALKLIQTL